MSAVQDYCPQLVQGVGFVVFSGSAQMLGWAKRTAADEVAKAECIPGGCVVPRFGWLKEQLKQYEDIEDQKGGGAEGFIQ